MNILGNNLADEMAKGALNLDTVEDLPLEYCDYKTKVKNYLNLKWQRSWDRINDPPNNPTKLYQIKPVLQDWSSSNRRCREEEIVLARLRLGTSLLNKKHLFTGDPFPTCTVCQTDLTMAHLLIECPRYNQERNQIVHHLNKERLHISLENILNDHFPHDLLFNFLNNIEYIKKI